MKKIYGGQDFVKKCYGSTITLSQYRGEIENSCIIIAYDLNRNGHWEEEGHENSEYFGYRLHNGSLEAQRGGKTCFSNGWEKLFDPREIQITHFTIIDLNDLTPGNLFKLQLSGHSVRNPRIQLQINSVINGKNL